MTKTFFNQNTSSHTRLIESDFQKSLVRNKLNMINLEISLSIQNSFAVEKTFTSTIWLSPKKIPSKSWGNLQT